MLHSASAGLLHFTRQWPRENQPSAFSGLMASAFSQCWTACGQVVQVRVHIGICRHTNHAELLQRAQLSSSSVMLVRQQVHTEPLEVCSGHRMMETGSSCPDSAQQWC